MKKIVHHQEILNISEQLIEKLRSMSGLIGIGAAAQFELLDEETYANYMNILSSIQDETITLGLAIQNYLYFT